MTCRFLGISLMATGAAIAVAAGVSPAQEPVQPSQPAGLPDLAMRAITDIAVHPLFTRTGHRVKGRWAVRFTSTVDNLGPGNFVVHGHRAKVGSPCPAGNSYPFRCEKGNMTGDQVVTMADGTTRTYKAVSVISFDDNHFHWHLRAASRYQLKSADGRRVLRRDEKTGFCFGDRIVNTPEPGPEAPGLSDGLATCRYGNVHDRATDGRRALSLTEGISAGYGDDYLSMSDGKPLEGQQLPLTGLRAGRYLLVNRTNARGTFRELTRSNDVSSALLQIGWPKGSKSRPSMKVLANCPGAATCAVPASAG